MAALLLLAPLAARGQSGEQPGLDLSQPPPPQANPREPAAPAGSATRPGRTPAERPPEAVPIAPGEADVALGDRVKAVQLKGFLKEHRLELGVSVPATLNDAFYEKVGVGAKLAYNLADSFAVAARGTYFWQIRSSHVREGQLAFSSQLLNSQVHFVGTLDGIWSPVYGKVAWLGSQIIHFDMYLMAGFGGVSSATGWHVATDFGGGIRFYPKSWLALDAGVVATLYPDQPSTVAPSTIQKIVAAQLGVTLYYPFTFEYSYP